MVSKKLPTIQSPAVKVKKIKQFGNRRPRRLGKDAIDMTKMEITQKEAKILLRATAGKWCNGSCPTIRGDTGSNVVGEGIIKQSNTGWRCPYIKATKEGMNGTAKPEDEEQFRKALRERCPLYRLVDGDKISLISDYHHPSHRMIFSCPFEIKPFDYGNENFNKLLEEVKFSFKEK